MNRTRMWYLLAGVSGVVVLALGWFLLVSPARDEASVLREDTIVADTNNSALEAQNAKLRKEFEKLPELKAKLAAIRTAIPDDPELPDLVRAITAVASAAGVSLRSVNPTTPQAAADGSVQTLPLQIDAIGQYANLTLFTQGLETMPRALLLTQVNVSRKQAGNTPGGCGRPGDDDHRQRLRGRCPGRPGPDGIGWSEPGTHRGRAVRSGADAGTP